MSTLNQLLELARREYLDEEEPGGGCVTHKHVSIVERDIDCSLCSFDVRSMLRMALKANKWLFEWQQEAVQLVAKLETEQDESLRDKEPTPEEGVETRQSKLRSEPDVGNDSVLPMSLDDGTRIVVDSIAGGGLPPRGLDYLRLAIEREGDALETVDFIRVSDPTRHCADKALEILQSFMTKD